ncbi:MAG: hypothetical protein KF752_11205 [Pirellulaceae bacterium]|nr:hypothetical protein [Pirellulaceae bacterium]
MTCYTGHILLGLLVCASAVGCQRRGYTDLYVDSMAGEIRDLEDQLYEYDHEYRLLEQELESLRRHNAALQSSSSPPGSSSQGNTRNVPAPPKSLDFLPRESLPAPQSKSAAPEIKQAPSPPGKEEQLRSSPPLSESPSSIIVDPPAGSQLRNPRPPPESLQPGPQNQTVPPNQLPNFDDSEDFSSTDLNVPTITTGAAMPPRRSVVDSNVPPENDLEMSLSQIELPTQLASTGPSSNVASIRPATQLITDKRIVEVAFHPSMSRSINLDDDDNDDGLYLVLQPKNQQGQVVPEAAALVVEVFDPARSDDSAKISSWRYTQSEIASKIQPLGSQQGVHLTLPWNGPNPKSDRVLVHITYTFENGRQIVARKEIFVATRGGLKTVWAPRASGSSMVTAAAENQSRVMPASTAQSQASQATVGPASQQQPVELPPMPGLR